MFATITNIVAYLPMLLITGLTGNFIKSLPIVLACSLVASRIVSMTFVPLLGYYFLLPLQRSPRRPIGNGRTQGFADLYYRFAGCLIEHRKTGACCVRCCCCGGVIITFPISGWSSFPRTFRICLSWTSGCRRTPTSPTTDSTAQARREM